MQSHLIIILNEHRLFERAKYTIDPKTCVFHNDIDNETKWGYYNFVCKELKIKNKICRSHGIDSDGGRKMKFDGHQNEILIKDEIKDNFNIYYLKPILNDGEEIVNVISDGKNSKKVSSVLNKKTTSKTDLKIVLNTTKQIKLSIKKSKNGQVHLNKVSGFINGYEKIYSEIPKNVKDGLLLLFSGHKDIKNILNAQKGISKVESDHQILSTQTLKQYNPQIFDELFTWISINIGNIVDIVFKTGWASDKNEWVDYILYKNNINDNVNFDNIFSVTELKKLCIENKHNISFGSTTIHLPFGHLQYHLGGLQFHHNHEKISKLFGN